MDVLPPRISDPELFALLAEIIAVRPDGGDTAQLRLRLIDPTFSWQALADLAMQQGVLLPLVWALRQRCLLLPVPKQRRAVEADRHPTIVLDAAYRRHLARRDRQREQLLAVIAALNRGNVVPLLLKGARYLVCPAGAWCEARDMRDIDLLVPREDAPRAVESLAAEGYAAGLESVPIDKHLPELWRAGCPSAVEIHTEALAFSARKMLPTGEVWRHGIRRSGDDGTFLILPPEWHLLHGLLNHQISDRGHARCLLAVKALWEFAALGAGLPSADWQSIAEHMAVRGAPDVLGSFIVQAQRLFGLAPAAGVRVSAAARAHAQRTFAHAARPDLLRRGYFLADQLRFGFARETMAARYGLAQSEVSLRTIGRHAAFLARRYRGQMLRRITGRDDSSS